MTQIYKTNHLGDPDHIYEGNIKINPREIGCEDVDWIRLVLDVVQW
jgi:hypothetical protein